MNLLVKKEYFELLKKLNHANKQKDMYTDVYFYIDRSDPNIFKLFAAISKGQKVILAEKDFNGFWKSKYLSGLFNLEEFIVKILNTEKQDEDVSKLIKLHIFKFE